MHVRPVVGIRKPFCSVLTCGDNGMGLTVLVHPRYFRKSTPSACSRAHTHTHYAPGSFISPIKFDQGFGSLRYQLMLLYHWTPKIQVLGHGYFLRSCLGSSTGSRLCACRPGSQLSPSNRCPNTRLNTCSNTRSISTEWLGPALVMIWGQKISKDKNIPNFARCPGQTLLLISMHVNTTDHGRPRNL